MSDLRKIKKVKQKLEQILNDHKTKKGETDYTHVSLGGQCFPGKFTISDSKVRAKLMKYVAELSDMEVNLSIAERPKDYGPIKIDVDLNYPEDEFKESGLFTNNRLYNKDMIDMILNLYKESIKEFCEPTEKDLESILFEKENYSIKNGELKDGFHIIFPHINLYYKIRHIIIESVIKKVQKESMFNKFTNADVIDRAVVSSNCWLLYGCCKPNKSPYTVSKYYDSVNNEMDVSLLGDTKNITKFLSLRDSKWNDSGQTKSKETFNDNAISEAYSELGVKKEKANVIGNLMTEEKTEMIEKSVKLTEMFSHKRANDFHSWVRVGWALHNTDVSLLDTWILFSKKSKKYQDGECEKMWDNMKDDGYTIRSLMLWAKEDNIEEYKNFTREYFNNILKKNNIDNTYCIAKALQCKYSDMFVCSDTKNHVWYYFENHRWNRTTNGGKLITLMSNDFANYYMKKDIEYKKKAMSANESMKKTLLAEAETFTKISKKLMDITFKKKIMEEAQYLFYEDDFQQRLDEKHHLIGFTNGVFDLKTRTFRDGQPDDHISMSTKVYYKPYNKENPYIKQIENFFESILPNKNVREYFLTRLSTCVSGENREEKAYFCTGSGSNGKSLTFKLMNDALGDYYISCPITIITKKRNAANQASPELARMKGPRCGVFQEPGDNEVINVGIFKELTGNDSFMVRGLFQDPVEITPQLKHFIATNDLPKITSDDGGTWRRIRVIPFPMKFVENPDPNNENEAKIDTKLKDKITKWAPTFASYLIHLYMTKYDTKNKVKEPEEVMMSTNKYRKAQDLIREFFEARIQVTEDKKDKMLKKDILSEFRSWVKSEHDGEAVPKSAKLYEFIEKEIKQDYPKSGGWRYLAFKDDEQTSEEEDNIDV
jgi:P4 family phage/plasmid primase-like protien